MVKDRKVEYVFLLAFGQRISWKDDDSVPPNHQMSFKDALHEVSNNLITKITVPPWALGVSAHTRKVRLAFEELEVCVVKF